MLSRTPQAGCRNRSCRDAQREPDRHGAGGRGARAGAPHDRVAWQAGRCRERGPPGRRAGRSAPYGLPSTSTGGVASMERHEFQAEVKQLLDLMIHSLYSHKDIFLRELISNASDALDRLRFEALTRPEWLPSGELQVRLEVEKVGRALTVHDNGIGMTKDEMVHNLGTIA